MKNHTVQLFRVGDENEPELITEISVPSGTNIMQIIDEQNIQLRRSCNQGICKICECATIQGVENLQNNKNKRVPENSNQVRVCVTEVHGDVAILITQRPSILASMKTSMQTASE